MSTALPTQLSHEPTPVLPAPRPLRRMRERRRRRITRITSVALPVAMGTVGWLLFGVSTSPKVAEAATPVAVQWTHTHELTPDEGKMPTVSRLWTALQSNPLPDLVAAAEATISNAVPHEASTTPAASVAKKQTDQLSNKDDASEVQPVEAPAEVHSRANTASPAPLKTSPARPDHAGHPVTPRPAAKPARSAAPTDPALPAAHQAVPAPAVPLAPLAAHAPARPTGETVVYLVDISGSMVDVLPEASAWVAQNFANLNAHDQAAVIGFNSDHVLISPQGPTAPTAQTVTHVRQWMSQTLPAAASGRSDVEAALHAALRLQADRIVLISDDGFNHRSMWGNGNQLYVEMTAALNDAGAQLDTVQVAYRSRLGVLARLAGRVGGDYTFVPGNTTRPQLTTGPAIVFKD